MLTFECKIEDEDAKPFLKEINELYCHLERKLFNSLYVKKVTDENKLKRDFMESEKISSTHYNSIKKTVKSKVDSKIELTKLHLYEDKERIKYTSKTIDKLEKRRIKLKQCIKQIFSYKDKLTRYTKKLLKRKPRKPTSKESERPINELRSEIDNLKFKIHQKKRRLDSIHCRFNRNKDNLEKQNISLCFGSKKLLNRQHHLSENGYIDHDDWKKDWLFSRSNQSFWLGDSTEKGHNRNAKLDLENGTIRFTVPERLRGTYGPFLTIKGISFSKKFEESILKSLKYEEIYYDKKSGKLKTQKYPISFRILEREKKGKKIFYLQVMLEVPPSEIVTHKLAGAIGIDLNVDHFAIGEVDRFGNPISGYSLDFEMEGKTKAAVSAMFGDAIRDMVLYAKSLSKPIVIEKLDFKRKKAGLREIAGPKLAHKLSLFAYNKVNQMLQSRCNKEGVELLKVNPSFSSILGSYNYYGMKHLYTPHQMAAFVLARRGLGFKDIDKSMYNDRDHVALFGTVGIQPEKAPPTYSSCIEESGVRHLWSYLRRYWKVFSLIMQKLKKESCSVYRTSIKLWRSKIEGLGRSLEVSNISLGLEDVTS